MSNEKSEFMSDDIERHYKPVRASCQGAIMLPQNWRDLQLSNEDNKVAQGDLIILRVAYPMSVSGFFPVRRIFSGVLLKTVLRLAPKHIKRAKRRSKSSKPTAVPRTNCFRCFK